MSVMGKVLKAPIPGENLVADTRKYAWHRPPQFPEFDDAFEHFIDDVIANKKKLTAGMSVVRMGVPATAAVSGLLVSMVGSGKISPDMSLLLAGPAYKVFTRVLDIADVPYLSGYDTREEVEAFIKASETMEMPSEEDLSDAQVGDIEEAAKEVQENPVPAGGLMGAPTEQEPMQMDLGEAQAGEALVAPPEGEKK